MKRRGFLYESWPELAGCRRMWNRVPSGVAGQVIMGEGTPARVWRFRGEEFPIAGPNMRWLTMMDDGDSFAVTAVWRGDALTMFYIDMIAAQGEDARGVPWYDDLYLDLILLPDGRRLTDDRDELDAALAAGDISARQHTLALETCERLRKTLSWEQLSRRAETLSVELERRDAERVAGIMADALQNVAGVEAVVLGGSRATGADRIGSDLDVGVYYRQGALDWDALNEAVRTLDDDHRENLVCREGGWGPWVNCGGWLSVDGLSVDLILRDVARVRRVLDETDRGEVSANYQTGHPHAYVSAMYRGELASCRTLWAKDELAGMKARAESYPEPLRRTMLNNFGFEMDFSALLARKALPGGDAGYAAGHLFRSVSCMHQALFALNRAWCLNEKHAADRIGGMALCPEGYVRRVSEIFTLPIGEGLDRLDALRAEVRAMMENDEGE